MPANMNGDRLASLKTISASLRKLHKALIDLETARFGQIGSPFEHLQLVSCHPQFAWIRRLSEILVELDERLDEPDEIEAATVLSYKSVIERLLALGPENDTEFSKKYIAALQESTDVAMAHGALRHLLFLLNDASGVEGNAPI
ncbi:hypothetical protein [Acerihabitans arboris]|uniref:Uncharacterized protein n=1 Tax=Acerihabitans arboris TaxID=2691583 RepID=A0A845SRG3_9GAMM|nr:hypothetical protein [Acerihabitans arboris]NDL65141.1 hypothetical protein [Acerihabitans arboris]